jgi:hypothetical protein
VPVAYTSPETRIQPKVTRKAPTRPADATLRIPASPANARRFPSSRVARNVKRLDQAPRTKDAQPAATSAKGGTRGRHEERLVLGCFSHVPKLVKKPCSQPSCDHASCTTAANTTITSIQKTNTLVLLVTTGPRQGSSCDPAQPIPTLLVSGSLVPFVISSKVHRRPFSRAYSELRSRE